MINLHSTQIDALCVHKVGNKSRGETLFLSSGPLKISIEQAAILKEYFLRPFREKEEIYYHFSHEVDLEFHDLYVAVNEMLSEPDQVSEMSKKIAQRLFQQSEHPHIKSGEVYIAYLSDMIVDHQKVSGVGIFKSESKHNFLQFDQSRDELQMIIQQGVSVSKLDKGCLIFNLDEDKGYRILSIDNNRYDAKYWLDKFLGVELTMNDAFFTKNYLKLCYNFAKDVVFPAEDKKEEVLFVNKAVDHFAKNDNFQESDFLNEVIEDPQLVNKFHLYKEEKGKKYSVEDVSSFPIANAAIHQVQKSFKNTINLDTNVQIKMNFVNPEMAGKIIEKGWDEERGMYYYLVYFNEEYRN